MRKLLIGAVVAGVMFAVAAIAMATTTQTYSQKYTTKKTNTSAGTSFATQSTEDENAQNNHQPKATREFDITFPRGSKIDYTTVPVCKHLDESADQPCPKKTKVGSGNATVLLPNPGTAPITADVTAYNAKKGLWLYVVPNAPGQAPSVLKPKFSGLTLKTKVAPLCIASTNQGGRCVTNTGQPGFEAVLTSFSLKTKPFKKGKKAYIRTPKTCPKGGWKFSAKVTYSDASSAKFGSTSACKR